MIKDRLQEILLHPLFLSLLIWIVIILFIPPLFSKYRIKYIRDEYTGEYTSKIYCDLNNDNESEVITLDIFDMLQTKIIVRRNNRVLDQYNIKYQPLTEAGHINHYIDDYNSDGYKELYVFTMNHDSVFLNIIDPIKLRKIILSGRFIDLRRHASQSTDAPVVTPVGMIRGTNSDNKDLIFFINTGYSRQPRNVYRYIIDADSLIKSPESGTVISNCYISDIDGDDRPELILGVDATGNFDEDFPFSDQYSWLMVFDNNLDFLFPPVQFRENPSNLKVIPFRSGNHTRLLAFHDYYGTEDINSSFYLFDSKGNKITEKPVQDYECVNCNIFANPDEEEATFYFLKNRSAEIEELDSNFKVIRTVTIPEIEFGKPLAWFDADHDGKKEYMFLGGGDRSLIITQDDFRYPAVFQYDQPAQMPLITQVQSRGEKPAIYLQFDGYGSYIMFSGNPLYYLKYPFYGTLYLVVFIFISLIYHIQKYRHRLKLQTERKIAGLQMKAVSNQIDPHFILNTLNSIGSLYATEKDREKADYIFGKYARLVKQIVISSDQIMVTLSEELDFVQNYIDLERFRCNNSFDYSINIDEGVDLQTKIPRMLIHTFVENAIKYGVRNKSEGGVLQIGIEKNTCKYHIRIEDNGPGLGVDENSISGTGKGLHIVNELIDLYYQLEKKRITYSLQNIPGRGNTLAGARVVIDIPRYYTIAPVRK